MEYATIMLKATVMFAVVLIGFRIMGNQAVGRLTSFDLVVVIALGALMGAPLADDSLKLGFAITAVATLVVVQRFTAYLTIKSKLFARMAIGTPIQVINQGEIIKKGLLRSRLTHDNLMEELRIKGLTSTADVEQAFLEPEGKLSVILKEDKQMATKSDAMEIKSRLEKE
jgi:uncharacterized membrane protein YcaP (DUF421 family)